LCVAGVSTALIVLQITVAINIFRHARYNKLLGKAGRVKPVGKSYPPPTA